MPVRRSLTRASRRISSSRSVIGSNPSSVACFIFNLSGGSRSSDLERIETGRRAKAGWPGLFGVCQPRIARSARRAYSVPLGNLAPASAASRGGTGGKDAPRGCVTRARPASLGRASLPHAIREPRAIIMRPDQAATQASSVQSFASLRRRIPLCAGLAPSSCSAKVGVSAPCSPLGARSAPAWRGLTLRRLPRALPKGVGHNRARRLMKALRTPPCSDRGRCTSTLL